MPAKRTNIKPRPWVLLPLLLALLSLPAQASQFVLLYSNDNVGEIEPCG